MFDIDPIVGAILFINFLEMKYLLIAFGFVGLVSCHDLHQKLYETFHRKNHAVAKDSTAKKDSTLKDSVITKGKKLF